MPNELEPDCKKESHDERCVIISRAIAYLRENHIDARLSLMFRSKASYIIALYDLPEGLFEEKNNVQSKD
jgi:hypothetical protein